MFAVCMQFLLSSIIYISAIHCAAGPQCCVALSGDECLLDINIVAPDYKVVRSGGRKRLFLFTSPVEELALEHGAALHQCIKVEIIH